MAIHSAFHHSLTYNSFARRHQWPNTLHSTTSPLRLSCAEPPMATHPAYHLCLLTTLSRGATNGHTPRIPLLVHFCSHQYHSYTPPLAFASHYLGIHFGLVYAMSCLHWHVPCHDSIGMCHVIWPDSIGMCHVMPLCHGMPPLAYAISCLCAMSCLHVGVRHVMPPHTTYFSLRPDART